MKVTFKEPGVAYLGNFLWLPFGSVSEEQLETDLLFEVPSRRPGEKVMYRMWDRCQNHYRVPRRYPIPGGIPLVDLRPTEFEPLDFGMRPEFLSFLDERQGRAYEALSAARDGILHLACGRGKTVLAIRKALANNGPFIVCVFNTGTVHQWEKEIREKTEYAGPIGHIWQNRNEWDKPVVIASMTTLLRRPNLPVEARHRFKTVLFDECFPAGTLVSGRPIETLRVGDLVEAFDPDAGTVEIRRVIRTFRSRPSALVHVGTAGGSITCTPGHPFWTRRGWVQAAALFRGDMVCYDPLQEVTDGKTAVAGARTEGTLCRVHSPSFVGSEAEVGPVSEDGKGLLLRRVQQSVHVESQPGDNGGNQPQVCVNSHEGEESYANGRRKEEDAGEAQGKRPWERQKGWKRQTGTCFPDDAPGRPGGGDSRMGHGASRSDEELCTGGQSYSGHPNLLQARSGESTTVAGDRGGREDTQQSEGTSLGREEGRVLAWTRVDSVEIQELDRPGELERLCPDGHVYNLEVEGLHTYLANGFVVHNCHHAAAETLRWTLPIFWGERLGLTATPERQDHLEGIIYSHVGPIFYSDLWQPLKPIVYFRTLPTQVDMMNPAVCDSYGGFNMSLFRNYLGTLMPRNQAIINDIQDARSKDRKVLALSHSVEHVRLLEQMVPESAHIDGDTPPSLRQTILKESKVIFATFGTSDEALDAPDLDTVLCLTPFQNWRQFQQGSGRSTRLHPDKLHPIVVIYMDASIGPAYAMCRNLMKEMRTRGQDFQVA